MKKSFEFLIKYIAFNKISNIDMSVFVRVFRIPINSKSECCMSIDNICHFGKLKPDRYNYNLRKWVKDHPF